MNHQIQASDFQYFESKTQLAGQFGGEIHKVLFIVTKLDRYNEVIVNFQVEENRVTVISTPNLKEAVEKYNSL